MGVLKKTTIFLIISSIFWIDHRKEFHTTRRSKIPRRYPPAPLGPVEGQENFKGLQNFLPLFGALCTPPPCQEGVYPALLCSVMKEGRGDAIWGGGGYDGESGSGYPVTSYYHPPRQQHPTFRSRPPLYKMAYFVSLAKGGGA